MHLNLKRNNVLFIILLLGIFSCEKPPEKDKNVVAKVNKEELTLENVGSLLNQMELDSSYVEIYKRRWIDREVLYLEALHDSLQYSNEYKRLIKNASKEILKGIYLDKFFEKNKIIPSEWELMQFYKLNKEEFLLNEKMYVFNSAIFNNLASVSKFRESLIKNGWYSALNEFRSDTTFVSYDENIKKLESGILNSKLYYVLSNLKEQEVGPIIKENGKYKTIVLIRKYNQNQIPDFKYIIDQIEERFIIQQKEKLYLELLNNLYKKYEVENY